MSLEDREIVITRIIDAPLARVWRAWADTSEIALWWGPEGFRTETHSREFRPGGHWKHTMIGPDGTRYPNLAKYEEIVEGQRIVYTNGGGREDGGGLSFRSTVTFQDRGGRTELTLRMVFNTPEMRQRAVKDYGAIEGGRQTLARLESLVK
jgi:uncharacterized protein YndB with AHSA1/START domain